MKNSLNIFLQVVIFLALIETYLVYTLIQRHLTKVLRVDDNSTIEIAEIYGQRPSKHSGNCSATSSFNMCRNESKGVNRNETRDARNKASHIRASGKFEVESFEENATNMYGEYFSKYFPKVKSQRMMIYTCNGKSLCGGWGDRLKGLYSVYFLSILKNMKFGIEITKPCSIEKFIHPSYLDWRVYPTGVKGKHVTILDKKAPPLTVHDILARIPSTDVVRVTFNEDYIDAFRSHKILEDKLPFLKTFVSSDIHRIMYHGLFKYEDSLVAELERFFQKTVKSRHLVSAHIRMGDQLTRHTNDDLRQIWDFLKQYQNQSEYKIFIASDTQKVKDIARKLFANQYVGLTGTIIHTDRRETYRNEDVCKGLRLSLLEHAVLARSDSLLLTQSGFGIEAAYIRYTSSNLFCYLRQGGIIPCQPQTLKSIYKR